MIVFLNIVLYSFLFLMEEHVHVGLWQTLLSNHPCHLLLTVCAEFGYPWNGGKSWSISTSNDNPFLITSNGVVLGPNTRHLYKGDTNHVIFGKGSLKYSRNPAVDVESCIERCLAGKWWLVMSQQWRITKVWQSRKTKNWGPEGDSELLDQPSMEALRLRIVLLWKTQYLLQPVDLGLLFYW